MSNLFIVSVVFVDFFSHPVEFYDLRSSTAYILYKFFSNFHPKIGQLHCQPPWNWPGSSVDTFLQHMDDASLNPVWGEGGLGDPSLRKPFAVYLMIDM